MIYKKGANFPYPLFAESNTSYIDNTFRLDINVEENVSDYRFYITHEIASQFIIDQIESGQAQLILVIQSKDNKFINLKLKDKYTEIPKSRISLSKRTTLQLLIQSKVDISFGNNYDLSEFYNTFKDEIVIPKNSILGFSNTVLFDGSQSKPLQLFEKTVNPNIKSDIKIELSSETIIINYKNESLQFNDSPQSATLNNPYIYMGLQKALFRFIANNSDGEEMVDLDELEPPEDGLDLKLYNLMKKKMVDEVRLDNLDEVIYSISDKILDKYTGAVRRLYSDGN